MKLRIQRHIEQRTALLASVSHDLRTPLTSLPGPAPHCLPSYTAYGAPSDWREMLTWLGPLVGKFNTCGDLNSLTYMWPDNVKITNFYNKMLAHFTST